MTEGIVDVLEAIEIEHQDREGRTAIPELTVELVEPGEEKGAVRQSGQDVGLRKLEHAAVGQRQPPRVAAGEHQIGRQRQCQQHADDQHGTRAIVSRLQRAAGGRNRPHLPIGVTDPEMAGPVPPPRDVTHRLRRGGCGGVIGQHAFQADDARVEGLIDVDADRGARAGPDADGLHQQREVEDADNEARDVAAPVDDGIARGALGVNGHDHEHVRQLARVILGIELGADRGDLVVIPGTFERHLAIRHAHIVDAVDTRRLRLRRVEDRVIFLDLRRGNEAGAFERLDAIARHPVGNRGGLVFGTLLAGDPRQPADAQQAGITLEQPAAEGFELAARDALVGGFEQGSQRHEPADIFVHAVLHDDGLRLGGVLELELVDAVFPARDRSGARDREQQADGSCDQRRAIEAEQRRNAPPSSHTPSILIILIAIAHLESARPLGAAA